MATNSAAAQALLWQVVDRWQARLRIIGLIEEPSAEGDTCTPGTLVSIDDGRRFAIGQDLGCGAEGCTLDSAAVVEAGHWLTERIMQSLIAPEQCDLLIINKFGKLEAESGGGLTAPLTAAVDLEIPVLLVVPARFREAWADFAGDMADTLIPDLASIEAWLTTGMANRGSIPARRLPSA
jgi:nucleoside-triphosphatase THEP1